MFCRWQCLRARAYAELAGTLVADAAGCDVQALGLPEEALADVEETDDDLMALFG